MKRTLLVISILVVAGAVALAAWHLLRTPFTQRYQHAVLQIDTQPAAALPVLQRALRLYDGTPEFADAIYQYACCQSALDATNVAAWEIVLNVQTARAAQAEARHRLAEQHPNRLAALEAFVRDFPEDARARQFLAELGTAAEARDDVVKAQYCWQQLADLHPRSPEARGVRDKLGALNIKLLCSPRPLPFTHRHVVERGETILAIAKRYTNTVDQIKRINGLKSDVITPGVNLKVDLSRYLIDVSIGEHALTLYRIWQGATNFVKRYSVGTGREDNTPRGSFRVILRQQNPTWYRAGSAPVPYGSPDNQLGTRWLGIDAQSYGIHGTWEPETIGSASSAGCIRMLNADVEELYDLVRVGTPVVIHD